MIDDEKKMMSITVKMFGLADLARVTEWQQKLFYGRWDVMDS
jgi:hypothetical protein